MALSTLSKSPGGSVCASPPAAQAPLPSTHLRSSAQLNTAPIHGITQPSPPPPPPRAAPVCQNAKAISLPTPIARPALAADVQIAGDKNPAPDLLPMMYYHNSIELLQYPHPREAAAHIKYSPKISEPAPKPAPQKALPIAFPEAHAINPHPLPTIQHAALGPSGPRQAAFPLPHLMRYPYNTVDFLYP